MKTKPILILICSLIVVSSASFYGGIQYQKSKLPNFALNGEIGVISGDFQARREAFANNVQPTDKNGTRSIGGQIAGKVISFNEGSLTIQTDNSSTTIVHLSDNTKTYNEQVIDRNTLKVGDQISVTGLPNNDNSLAAATIHLQAQ